MSRPLCIVALALVGCPEEPHGPRSTPPVVPVDAGPHPPRPAKEPSPTELDLGPDDVTNRAAHVGAALDLVTGRTKASMLPVGAGAPPDALGTIGLGNLSPSGEDAPEEEGDPPAPGFTSRVERAARVSAVTGPAAVAVGARCRVGIAPVREWSANCRLSIVCGATTLYGTEGAGYAACFVERGVPVRAYDRRPAGEDRDPMVFIDAVHDRAVVSDDFGDGPWNVTLALVR